ncbi:PspC domain-containing protein [Sphingomonas arenae]|uniref:PspC domain-containing protein n=1 Tax=Sphingomonas arenae TaxID=2812555 RepID=UPI001967E5F6|nr:PspC domain-containing protein [Sphingomonas arenae]
MASEKTNLFLRNDTIFGVCEGLGEDLGFNPNFLRVPLGTMIIFAPVWAVGIYAALGLVVLASRLLFPDRRIASAAAQTTSAAGPVAIANADNSEERVLEAA